MTTPTEPTTEHGHPRRRLNRLHALRSKWGDCYWKPGDDEHYPGEHECESFEADLIEFENDVRADFVALIRKAEARDSAPLDEERLTRAIHAIECGYASHIGGIWTDDDDAPNPCGEKAGRILARLTTKGEQQ